MPHQCVHCSKIYPDVAKELLEGCSCGSHFFFYLKEEQIKKLKQEEIHIEFNEKEKEKIESDVREIMGIEQDDIPVILDLESVRVLGPGKFEIDLVRLFDTKRPLVYKLDEGKYVIDLATTFKTELEKSRNK